MEPTPPTSVMHVQRAVPLSQCTVCVQLIMVVYDLLLRKSCIP